ncbi:MAG: adenosylcobinamide-phosphate synthase CbiB [Clostridiaceae bacterium]
MILNLSAMLTAVLIDAIIGDPEGIPHIVIFFGKLISYLDKNLNKKGFSKTKKLLLGLLTVIILGAVSVVPAYFLQRYLPDPFKFIFAVIIFWYCIALKTLKTEALLTGRMLKGSLDSGRRQVSRIVGRQTSELTETGVVSAVIETVAENASDGVIAPMFYGLIFGPAGALFYKAANTMDSMIAYKTIKHIDFGFFAAKLDDVLNLIPSRITGILAVLCAPLIGGSMGYAFDTFLEDRNKHESPNSAQCESAFAGALDVVLNGPAIYNGVKEEKPYLNKSGRTPEIEDIKRAVTLLNYVTIAFLTMAVLIHIGVMLR